MPNPQYIVIVGCGRLGSILASNLSSGGNSVVVIDSNDNSFNHLTSEFSGFKIVGDAAELSVLQTAKVNQADCLLAVTNNDNINLMVAQLAQTVF
ncbi:MAG: NAD-binding protein, partial [Oscillatoria sp. PMC 1076.18]|nr:NAD-binding protein [Oscillatoria sp. PMC 1076.18]